MKNREWTSKVLLENTKDQEFFSTKFSPYLPERLQEEIHIASEINIQALKEYLISHLFRVIKL
jgi:ATP-dependent Lhr-like helicase